MRLFKLTPIKKFALRGTLKEFQFAALFIFFWLLRILFFGWYAYLFQAEKTTVTNEQETALLFKGIYNKHAAEMVRTFLLLSENPYPFTFTERPHPIFAIEVFTIENEEFRFHVGSKSKLTMRAKNIPK